MERDAVKLRYMQLRQGGALAFVTLNEPAKRNALSTSMLEALSSTLLEIESHGRSVDPSGGGVRAVLLRAEGPAFCAGHDLKEMTTRRADADGGRAFFTRTMQACSTVMQQIVALPAPVIAIVDGMATAAGCQLVATCDLAVASPNARFCTPGVDIGLFCSTPAVALSRNVARKQAMEMLLTGEVVSAEHALRIGLVNRVVENADAAALDLAQKIASKSPQAIRFGKKAFYAQLDAPLAQAYAQASAVMVENMLADDAREGIAAFIDKRAPAWRG